MGGVEEENGKMLSAWCGCGFGSGFREELQKQQSRERYMKLQEEGKTEQAQKDLGMMSRVSRLI